MAVNADLRNWVFGGTKAAPAGETGQIQDFLCHFVGKLQSRFDEYMQTIVGGAIFSSARCPLSC